MGIGKHISDRCRQRLASCRRLIADLSFALNDEMGGLLGVKLVGAAVIGICCIDAVVPEMYDRYAAQGVVISGLAMTAYGIFGPWES